MGLPGKICLQYHINKSTCPGAGTNVEFEAELAPLRLYEPLTQARRSLLDVVVSRYSDLTLKHYCYPIEGPILLVFLINK